MSFEQLIFSNIINNPEYARKVSPFLRSEYFSSREDRVVFEIIDTYINKYQAYPSKEAVAIELSNLTDLNESEFDAAKEVVESISETKDNATQLEWLLEKTEKFCQDKAIYNAITKAIQIMDDKNGKFDKGIIPEVLSEALAVSFDTNIGHDFLEDFDKRYEFYHRKEERIPFDIEYFNKITKGGLPRKTLSIIMAPTGVGKSLIMCHMAAANLALGKNVLYITMEMAEEKIAERIDANLINTPLDELGDLPRDVYEKRVARVKDKTTGRLIIKEYPTSCAGSANFRHLLNELKLKKGFVPDIIYIDYLNICSSSRIKNNGNVNSYTYIKTIAEELRGLAVEQNVPIVSATQTNRGGFNNSDIDLTNTSESVGLPATCDMMFAVIQTDELRELGQYMVIQLKNRFSDIDKLKRFMVGVDKSRMKLYNVEESAQKDLMSSPVDVSSKKPGAFDRKNFDGFK